MHDRGLTKYNTWVQKEANIKGYAEFLSHHLTKLRAEVKACMKQLSDITNQVKPFDSDHIQNVFSKASLLVAGR